jgi:ABC-2 type transport system permease protein
MKQLFSRFKVYWRLFWHFRVLQLQVMMEYRSDFFFWLLVSTLWTIFHLFFFTIFLNVRGEIGGWQRPELYLLIGTFTMLDAFTWSFLYVNMRSYTQVVYKGELDLTLVRPIDPQFLLTTRENSYSNILRFVIGIAIVIHAIRLLELSMTVPLALGYIALLIISLLFIYTLWFIVATAVFWVEKLDSINDIVPELRKTFEIPYTVYTGLASTFFTVILPLGLVTSVPSEWLLTGQATHRLWYFVAFTLVFFWLSRRFFWFSLRRYQGVGS